MPASSTPSPNGRPRGRAFSLVEAAVSIAIVGVMLVAALNTVGASQVAQKKMADRSRGILLAQDLMSEILSQYYEDPAYGPGSFGLGDDEVGDGSRALWDDVDDYHGWSASPPQRKNGTEFSGFDGWARSVRVQRVSPTDFALASPSDTGVKQITVAVTCNNVVIASLVAIRTNAMELVQEPP